MTRNISNDRRKAERVALISLAAAVGLIIAKLTAGLASGSLAILSEAAHSALDAGATALTYFAVRIASRPPDEEHPYGHSKAENISALLETIALLGLSLYIAVHAVERLTEGGTQARAEWYGFAVIILSIVVDASRARVLKREGKRLRSAALQADALHFSADLLTSLVVLIGLVFVRLGYPEADPIGSLAIAGYVAIQSVTLGRKSIDVLMDRAPTGAIERIQDAVAQVEGVEEVRRVRVRYSGGEPQMDVVVAISRSIPLERAHELTEEVERVISEMEPGADVVVHVEPIADEVRVTEQVHALALREPEVREVHNVYVTAHPEGLHISLHAKMPGSMALSEAHDIVERLERNIEREIESVARVDTHMEPLEEADKRGRDATSAHSEMVGWVRVFAESISEVHGCHEVVVTEAEGSMSMVVHCEAEAGSSVQQVHDASTRIETEVHARWPQIERVTVHFEPLAQ